LSFDPPTMLDHVRDQDLAPKELDDWTWRKPEATNLIA
jgi:hypothetical protein